MKRKVSALILMLAVTVAALAAQAPPGWMFRAMAARTRPIRMRRARCKLMAMGFGFHVVTPQAAVFWNPANTATGTYTLRGTFTLLKPSGHTNYYGLVFGGSALDNAAQRYSYFLVAQNGTFLVKQRNGNAATDVVGAHAERGGHAAGCIRPFGQRPRSAGCCRQGGLRRQRDGGPQRAEGGATDRRAVGVPLESPARSAGRQAREAVTRLTVAASLALCATVLAEVTDAWGPQGHRLVAAVAANHLSPAARRAVANLLGPDSLPDVAIWADDYRSGVTQTGFWHYVNIPPDASAMTDRDRDCPRQPGVAAGCPRRSLA